MIVFTFPGQGSQKPGMGAPWVDHPSWELVTEASDAAGRDVAHLLLEADTEELRATRNSQLSTFVLSLVVLDAVERIGVEPARVAGHSLGEYSALTAAGTVAFDDGVRLVGERGDAMQAAAETSEGTMAAVLGLDDDQVDTACRGTDGDVWVANYNAPGQVVIAGAPAAVDAAGDMAKRLGAKKAMKLPVSGAFHTPFMAPAADRLQKAISATELRAPDVPVLANVDAAPHHTTEEWEEVLVQQLTRPVRWRAILHALADDGAGTLVELGPGSVLTGMAKRTLKGRSVSSVSKPDHLDALLELVTEPSTEGRADEGEGLYISERLVVSPATGVFALEPGCDAGQLLEPGDLIGWIGDEEVRSPFSGTLAGLLAAKGERVTSRQPIAWLQAGT